MIWEEKNMAEKMLMLALSPTMETGIIARWVKTEGEAFKSGDVMCEIETDKATMEYEASGDGVLLKILVPEGQDASVGDPIAITGQAGEDYSSMLSGIAPAASANKGAAKDIPANETPKEAGITSAANAAVPVDARPVKTNIVPGDNNKNTADTIPLARSSPLARKIAQDAGIRLDTIAGSGPKGRVVKRDVENTLSAGPSANTPPAGIPAGMPKVAPVLTAGQDEVLPVSGKRRIIAQRLSESKFSAPHYYLKLRVAMDGILQARKQYAASAGEKISINTYLIKFAAEALKKHPVINSSWNGSTIIRHGRIDIGLAVALKDGLITPVVRDCGSKGMLQIERELKELIQKAQSETLKPEEYAGATFTISSLGSFGIEEFTAIINPPGSAILAVGEIIKEQVVNGDDSISIKSNMKLTLSCDHRVIDGAVGAAFLAGLKSMLEEPVRALY